MPLHSASKLINIISPYLVDHGGHDLNYALSVLRQCEKENIQTTFTPSLTFKNKDCSHPISGYIPFLSLPLKQYKGLAFIFNFFFKTTFNNISIFLKIFQLSFVSGFSRQIFLFPTYRPTDLVSIVFASYLIPSGSRIILVNHYSFSSNIDHSRLKRLISVLFSFFGSLLSCPRRVIFCADSTSLVREMTGYYTKPVHLLPIPDYHSDATVSSPRTYNPKNLLIGYFGLSTIGKGFHKLPHILKTASDNFPSISFRIQYNNPDHDHRLHESFATIRTFNNVESILEGSLTPSAYNNSLGDCDILLFPYDKVLYSTQTSGVFTEARSMGKVVLVPSGTWLSDDVIQHRGGVICDFDSSESIYSSFKQLLTDIDQLMVESANRSSSWNSYHSPSSYIYELLKLS